ncbi:L-alanine dehydrogenase [[Clostridium] ultunense Esp]|uniref:Alanine dehydrogenase n=1 Tax=[Clostridium] ultunense Esp TaxID=1288971 RepID=M1YRE9_9FIRM|nr:alanine dehydrogenase [Schnuerera ultunensis]CCQ93140.1 L-alanine dehydrogenase [[Clostridium] ultunense Esp]SHD76771.1 L-alanine dehydrogenase (NAD-dependent) [[Clostridium] ultunense Esp]
MIVGVPKEIKEQENRVALTPAGVDSLVRAGHKVIVETNAGMGAGFSDEEYSALGAEILPEASKVWEQADMIMKVKEPLKSEYKYFRKDLIIFTYLHLAAEEELTKALVESGTIAIAYETVQNPDRSLPLLTPMSEVAGRMAVQQGSVYLEKTRGGKGLLIDGVPGVPPAHVVVVGAGIVGTGAIRRAIGLGARVTVLDINVDRLRYLGEVFMGRLETLYSNNYNLTQAVKTADLVVGAVLIPGAKAPKLVTEEMVKLMEPGSVLVDVAIDQGGCMETTHPTTHADPIFMKHDVVHYAVANIPGAVPRTSTLALTNVTLPYAVRIANKGWKQALIDEGPLRKGANVLEGKIVYKSVADAFDMPYTPVEEVLGM